MVRLLDGAMDEPRKHGTKYASHAVLGTRVFGVPVVSRTVGLRTPHFVHKDARAGSHAIELCLVLDTEHSPNRPPDRLDAVAFRRV